MTSGGVPPLDPERWARAEQIFHEAAELPRAEAVAFVARACADDTELRDRVERLLEADASRDGVLDRSVESFATPLFTGEPEPAAEVLPPGKRVGRYRIRDVLGSGGMGTVYRAERADGAYDRVVALKMVRSGRLLGSVEGRFRREREILARLVHPGIATLLDGDVGDGGLPYLAMELVDGTSITSFAESRGLDVRARIRLVLQVTEAVDYAHRNLVVHRDLKPSNILVTDAGAVKLLDFGIARLVADDPVAEPETRTGQLLLTPEYAAPEQILGAPLTTAVDVYAIGAVLYELLTGRRPFGDGPTGWSRMQRVVDEPATPPSKAEGLDRARRRALEGDLDTIVLKALQKEPGRRYASAREVGDDLRSFLEGRPVRARRDSVVYRFSKLLHRNPVASLVSGALLVAALLGVGGALWQARVARIEADRRDAVADFMISVFEGASPEAAEMGRQVTAVQLLENGLAGVDRLAAGPEVRVDLLVLMGELFGRLGQYDRAETVLRRAVGEADSSLRPSDPAIANARAALGSHLAIIGDLDEAETLLRAALAARRSDGSSSAEIRSSLADLGAALRRRGEYAEAAALYLEAIRLAESETGDDSLAFATELLGLGQVRHFQDDLDEAVRLFEVVVSSKDAAGIEDTDLAYALHDLGVALAGQERNAEAGETHGRALELWQRLFPNGHPEVARSYEAIARVSERLGRWEEADSLYREAIAAWSPLYGDDHTQIAAIRVNQANLRYFRGDFAAAAEAYRDGIRIWRVNEDRRLLGAALRNLGVIETAAGDYTSADTLLAEALQIRTELNGPEAVDVAEVRSSLAGLRNREGRHAEAEEEARAATGVFERLLEPDHRLTLNARMQLGEALAARGMHGEAAPLLEAVHARFAETLNPADAQLGRAALWWGVSLAGLGRAEEARSLIEEAVPILETGLGAGAPETRRARAELTRLRG